ncbi:cytochrome P450 [Aspergillus aculeatinus CBS 121060]|uniref:Cytochrome P450 oxidoreductase n=1 Tax=Aspergillus aculeatinus CBS 121060 TaxID=1448322 RepID=A0ACD1H770_9EURO|nr:cytochrome P450 oxidoreductase [Aspergillus aculeatinus CBS 121060]RAH69244.1 cytochrome P450 oxidoreductase [Aspergillus aculeatinus CBS 121060]
MTEGTMTAVETLARDWQPWPLLLIIAVVGMLVSIVWMVRSAYHLRKIPGPWWAPYTRLWLFRALYSERCAEVYLQVNRQYGPLVRIGPNHLITNDPGLFRQILGVQSKYNRGPWFDALRLDPHNANLITERHRQKHDALRAKMAPGYQGKDLPQMEKTIDHNLLFWLEYIQKHALTTPDRHVAFDLARSIQWLLFDMVCHLCLGHSLGFVDQHEDCFGFQNVLETRLPIVEKFAVFTEVNTWIKVISRIPWVRRVLPTPQDQDGIGAILGVAEKTVRARVAQGVPPKINETMLDSWLRNGVDPSLAVSEVTIALFAGSDTTATSIRALMLHVISNPIVYSRLTEEIRGADKRGQLGSPVVSERETKSLAYLQACILEGLRVFPPITALRERVVPAGGDTLNGVFIPAGTNVGLNLPGLLRHEPAFGPDADVFRPERWLEATPDQRQRMDRVHELMFNWGSTRCLGIRLAQTMMSKVLVEVFRRWDLVSLRPQQPWHSRCHGIFLQKDFNVRITEAPGSTS